VVRIFPLLGSPSSGFALTQQRGSVSGSSPSSSEQTKEKLASLFAGSIVPARDLDREGVLLAADGIRVGAGIGDHHEERLLAPFEPALEHFDDSAVAVFMHLVAERGVAILILQRWRRKSWRAARRLSSQIASRRSGP
jgi:hypothetical protein